MIAGGSAWEDGLPQQVAWLSKGSESDPLSIRRSKRINNGRAETKCALVRR
jgi:hypothetical protein